MLEAPRPRVLALSVKVAVRSPLDYGPMMISPFAEVSRKDLETHSIVQSGLHKDGLEQGEGGTAGTSRRQGLFISSSAISLSPVQRTGGRYCWRRSASLARCVSVSN